MTDKRQKRIIERFSKMVAIIGLLPVLFGVLLGIAATFFPQYSGQIKEVIFPFVAFEIASFVYAVIITKRDL